MSGYLSVHFRNMGAYDQAIASAQRALALATAGNDSAEACSGQPLPSLPCVLLKWACFLTVVHLGKKGYRLPRLSPNRAA